MEPNAAILKAAKFDKIKKVVNSIPTLMTLDLFADACLGNLLIKSRLLVCSAEYKAAICATSSCEKLSSHFFDTVRLPTYQKLLLYQ